MIIILILWKEFTKEHVNKNMGHSRLLVKLHKIHKNLEKLV